MSEKKGIILYPNAERDIGFKMTESIAKMFESHGRRTVSCPVFGDDAEACVLPDGFIVADIEEELPRSEMIITLGGDGTILHAARAAAGAGVPILGINLGRRGFLAELEADDIKHLDTVIQGGYTLENRMMLDVEVMRGGRLMYKDFALNDAVIRGDNKVIDLMLFGDGQMISRFYGDGAVVATPTGSTGYSMAAGGPIVEEAAHNIIVTPICAHVLEAKSFVLVSDRHVSVELGDKKNNPAYLSVDGGEHVSIHIGDVINVHKSERYTRFVRLSNRNFYTKVNEKLGERS